MSAPTFIRPARQCITALALIDMVLVILANGGMLFTSPWWGTVVAFIISLLAFTFYLISIVRKVYISKVTRAFAVIFPAMFFLGIKFTLVFAIINTGADMAYCMQYSQCHIFIAEVVLSIVLGFLMVFEAYTTLKHDGQELPSQKLQLEDVENQMHTVSSQPQVSPAFDHSAYSNIVRPVPLPTQSYVEKPQADKY
ncbi:hypothetical protein EC991_008870 [Linnemannia zychae]|nr:hypothetical protein EC991_008870 [Linnemannia zychae]